MKRLIVTYDLSDPGRNYNALYRRIRQYRNWRRITESTVAIKTTSTPVQVRDYLGVALDSNDKIFVGTLNAPTAWRGLSKDVADWIKS